MTLARLAVALAAVLLTLGAAELATRWLAPVPDLFPHWQWDAVPDDWQARYQADSDIGYRPILGSGKYSEFGTLVNDYPEVKPEGTTRVLFLGDSVAHRGRIQKHLLRRCAEEAVEFWNAGVEGFNTGQAVGYYLRWNRPLQPDHVTLIFHNNDFVATPVAYRDEAGEIAIANPLAYLTPRSVALAARSHLYRHYLRQRVASKLEKDSITSEAETREALARLKSSLDADGIGFNVILMPVLKPLVDWTEMERRSRELSLEILADLGIPVFDLVPPLEAGLENGLETHEAPGDIWHPNDAIARRFARHLARAGYLESLLPPDGCNPRSE